MPSQLTQYRIFAASPSGLDPERSELRSIVDEYNDTEAIHSGLRFTVVGWEDVPAHTGRPQAVINSHLVECDYFVMMLCDRWGSPTTSGEDPQYTSGSEEEFEVARSNLSPKGSIKSIVLLFKRIDAERARDPGPQLSAVLAFKSKLTSERTLLFEEFGDMRAFGRTIRRQLGQWCRVARPTAPQSTSGPTHLAREIAGAAPAELKSMQDELRRKEAMIEELTKAIERLQFANRQGIPEARKATAAVARLDVRPMREYLIKLERRLPATESLSSPQRIQLLREIVATSYGDEKVAIDSLTRLRALVPEDVDATLDLALIHLRNDRFEMARPFLEFLLAHSNMPASLQVFVHTSLADIDTKMGNFERTASHLEAADRVVGGATDSPHLSLISLRRGELAFEKRELQTSLNYCESSLANARRFGQASLLNDVMGALSVVLIALGRYEDANHYLGRMEIVATKTHNAALLASVHSNKAVISLATGDPRIALALLSTAEALAKTTRKPAMLAIITVNQGLALWYLGERNAIIELSKGAEQLELLEMKARASRVQGWILAIKNREPPPDPSTLG